MTSPNLRAFRALLDRWAHEEPVTHESAVTGGAADSSTAQADPAAPVARVTGTTKDRQSYEERSPLPSPYVTEKADRVQEYNAIGYTGTRLHPPVPEREPSSWPDEIAERAAIAVELGGVPARYAGAFAELQMRCPAGCEIHQWELAIDDVGRFFDQWGAEAEQTGWSAADLIGQAGWSLVWTLQGRHVIRLSALGATLSDGSTYSLDDL